MSVLEACQKHNYKPKLEHNILAATDTNQRHKSNHPLEINRNHVLHITYCETVVQCFVTPGLTLII